MRDFLAQRAPLERQPDATPLTYQARIGRYGSNGRTLVLEDVRTADTDEHVTDHVWLPHTHEFKPFRPGDVVRFAAYVRPYVKHGEPTIMGSERQKILDYGFNRPTAVEKIARREDMGAYQLYLMMMKQADDLPVAAPVAVPAAPATDLRVISSADGLQPHLNAQTGGYLPVATLQDPTGGITHIVYSHRRNWNAARSLLYRDPARFTVEAHGLAAPGATPPGGRLVPTQYQTRRRG